MVGESRIDLLSALSSTDYAEDELIEQVRGVEIREQCKSVDISRHTSVTKSACITG